MDSGRQVDLSGVGVVVTGGTSGLGAAMSEALLRAGASVVVAARPTGRLDEAVAAWRAEGLEAHGVPLDVRDPGSVDEAATQALRVLGRVDLLVNNAGIGMRGVNPRFFDTPQPFFEVTPEQFGDLFATNVTGYFLVARAFSRLFLDQGAGRIANVSISYSTMSRRGFVPYGPSRAATEAMSMVMTEDLRPFGIDVNVVLPGGATATGMIPEDIAPEARAKLLPATVMGPPAVFLASPEAAGMTGERIVGSEFDSWLASWRARGAT